MLIINKLDERLEIIIQLQLYAPYLQNIWKSHGKEKIFASYYYGC